MIQAAKRIISSTGTIVSFNGNGYDLIEISKLLDIPSIEDLHIQAKHDDMMKIISAVRWPIDPGTKLIRGQNLHKNYQYYFKHEPTPPLHLKDDYIINNWLDCYMAAELWKKWKRGALCP